LGLRWRADANQLLGIWLASASMTPPKHGEFAWRIGLHGLKCCLSARQPIKSIPGQRTERGRYREQAQESQIRCVYLAGGLSPRAAWYVSVRDVRVCAAAQCNGSKTA